MNHCDIILKHLNSGKSITKVQALSLYGILNLGDVIMRLRHKCHSVITTMIPREIGAPYAEYSLRGK